MPDKRGHARSGPRPKLDDPYLIRKAYPEPTICPVCGLVYHNKRWSKDDHILNNIKAVAHKHKCPSCRKIEDRFAMGLVFISSESDFIEKHKTEIINLIRNEEKREFIRNPLDRIMSLKEIRVMNLQFKRLRKTWQLRLVKPCIEHTTEKSNSVLVVKTSRQGFTGKGN